MKVYLVYERGATPRTLRVFAAQADSSAYIATQEWPHRWVCLVRTVTPVSDRGRFYRFRLWLRGANGPSVTTTASTHAGILRASRRLERATAPHDPRAYGAITRDTDTRKDKA